MKKTAYLVVVASTPGSDVKVNVGCDVVSGGSVVSLQRRDRASGCDLTGRRELVAEIDVLGRIFDRHRYLRVDGRNESWNDSARLEGCNNGR